MDDNTLSICISIGIGLIAIAIGIYFGLHRFTNRFGNKVESVKTEVVGKLSNIESKLEKIDSTTGNIFQLASLSLGGGPGTVELDLKNFGKTKVTARPSSDETEYLIEVERGRIESSLIDKLSKETALESIELELFNKPPDVTSLKYRTLIITVPSTDPILCTKYINIFLTWLDTEYVNRQKQTISDFESGISIS